MMSYTASATWSRPVSSLCCTEHRQRRGVVLSGRINTVVMSRSGQLSRRCTVESNCSGMSGHLAGASVIRERALKICEPNCVPRVTWYFFILVVNIPPGAILGYVPAPELSSRGDRARSHGIRDSAGAHIDREAMSEAKEHVAAPELNLARRRDPGPRDTW
jgi:hypothetical protein